MRDLVVRCFEPEDHEAVHRVFSSPRAMAGTSATPFSAQGVRRIYLPRTQVKRGK